MIRLISLTASILIACSSAWAQSYPTRFITMVNPWAPGGTTDVFARILADGMSEEMGQRVVVENQAGAGGTTGSIRVMRSNPDGYTIVVGHMGTHGSSYSLYTKIKYDPRTDFEPVGLLASAPIVVFTRKDFPASNLKDFIAYTKSQGDKVKVGHNGLGSNSHVTCALFSYLIGVQPTEVGYRGNGPLMNDLLGGQIDYSCDQVITVAPQVSGGAIKAITVASMERSKVLPDTPTTTEGQLPAFQADAWTAIFAPPKTPKEIVDKLNQAMVKALDNPNVVKRLTELGAVVPTREQRTPEYLRALVDKDVKRWADFVAKAKLKTID
jgi:tripartite-type tricarboxylate transporter receptor subunit TctC